MIRIYLRRGIPREQHHVAGQMLMNDVFHKPVELAYGSGGKPYSKNLTEKFSLSHSGDVVGLAVGNQELGFDLEQIRPVRLGRFVRPEESKIDPLTLFVVKESTVKWTGEGLKALGGCRVLPAGKGRFWSETNGEKVMVQVFDWQGYRFALAAKIPEPYQIIAQMEE